jgi:imidazolonepropionase-like amidohydrolase
MHMNPKSSSATVTPAALAGDDGIVQILAGKLFNSSSLEVLQNQLIKVNKSSGLIIEVTAFSDDDIAELDLASPDVHDLRHLTVLPGFVDVHVHCEVGFSTQRSLKSHAVSKSSCTHMPRFRGMINSRRKA